MLAGTLREQDVFQPKNLKILFQSDVERNERALCVFFANMSPSSRTDDVRVGRTVELYNIIMAAYKPSIEKSRH